MRFSHKREQNPRRTSQLDCQMAQSWVHEKKSGWPMKKQQQKGEDRRHRTSNLMMISHIQMLALVPARVVAVPQHGEHEALTRTSATEERIRTRAPIQLTHQTGLTSI